MRNRHWYSRFGVEEPFPWLGLGLGTLGGLALAVVAPFLLFNLRDTNLLNIR